MATVNDVCNRSLEKLADVNLAEEGMLRLLLASAFRVFCEVSTQSEMALASRSVSSFPVLFSYKFLTLAKLNVIINFLNKRKVPTIMLCSNLVLLMLYLAVETGIS